MINVQGGARGWCVSCAGAWCCAGCTAVVVRCRVCDQGCGVALAGVVQTMYMYICCSSILCWGLLSHAGAGAGWW